MDAPARHLRQGAVAVRSEVEQVVEPEAVADAFGGNTVVLVGVG
jgi:hypothetical protein